MSTTTSSITVTWQEPNYNGGNSISNYAVYVNNGAGGSVLTKFGLTGSPSVRTLIVTGLTRGALYQFSVTAFNTIGESL